MKAFLTAGLLALAILTATLVSSCGTLLYPERKGQSQGNVDINVVLLDGIGLFFFLIPGIIAYVVDFSTGAIYLPPGGSCGPITTESLNEMTKIETGDKHLSKEKIELIILRELGILIDMNDKRLQISPVK